MWLTHFRWWLMNVTRYRIHGSQTQDPCKDTKKRKSWDRNIPSNRQNYTITKKNNLNKNFIYLIISHKLS